MSFGFDQNERDEGFNDVSKAITQVYEDRNRAIIFLAAATNSETYQPSGTMFPARHHYVIPIHQTDHKGVFERNPNSSHEILGTLGSGVPNEVSSTAMPFFQRFRSLSFIGLDFEQYLLTNGARYLT
jgi:hypothetical protein